MESNFYLRNEIQILAKKHSNIYSYYNWQGTFGSYIGNINHKQATRSIFKDLKQKPHIVYTVMQI